MKIPRIILFASALLLTSLAVAHPTGNMITVGKNILWSYVNPLDDPAHHACVMIWDRDAPPRVFIQSEYPASDYLLYHQQGDIYIIERRYIQATQQFEARVLKTTIDGKPTTIWNWFEDKWRVGEGGFFMISDHQMVFGRYPHIYSLEKGEEPVQHFAFHKPINKIRALANGQMLLLGETSCWLVEQDGTIKNQWLDLIDDKVENPPLHRNQIFDVDYHDGQLLLAYWGKRAFEIIRSNGNRETLLLQKEPLTPHWVAFYGNEKLLFSSLLDFSGDMPKPNLSRITAEGEHLEIWQHLR